MKLSLFWYHSLFCSSSIYFLAYHPALQMLRNRKSKQKSENEVEKRDSYMNCLTLKLYQNRLWCVAGSGVMTSPVGVRFSKKLAAVNSLHSTTAQCTPLQEFHRVCLISIKMYSLWKFVSYCLISYENYTIIYVTCEEGTLQGKGSSINISLQERVQGRVPCREGYLAGMGTLQGQVPCRDGFLAG